MIWPYRTNYFAASIFIIMTKKKKTGRNRYIGYEGRKGYQEYKGGTLKSQVYDDLYNKGKQGRILGDDLEELKLNHCGNDTDNNYSAKVAVIARGYREYCNKTFSIRRKLYSNFSEEIKEKITSQIPTKEVIITETSRKILERLENNKKNKKESREDIIYHDQPIRRNNIVLRKPEIRYRREDIKETPEMINKSIMEFPDNNNNE